MAADDAISVPAWTQPPTLTAIEDRIDSALSSANGILNFVLGPVRSFVHAVLHPIFAFADLTIGWVYQVVHWVFVHLQDLANDARRAVSVVWFDTGNLVTRVLGDLVGAAVGVLASARQLIDNAVNGLQRLVRGWVDDAIHYASAVADGARRLIDAAVSNLERLVRGWVDDAVHYTSRVADALRALIAQAADATLGAAQRLVADAVAVAHRLADDALAAARGLVAGVVNVAHQLVNDLWHNVVDPLVHRFESFLANEFRWAYTLLKLFEQSAEWIAWVGSHAVPEAVATYQVLRDLGELTADEALNIGRDLLDL